MSGKKFDKNDSAIIDYEHGHYQHSEVLWNCESLSQKAAQHILFNDMIHLVMVTSEMVTLGVHTQFYTSSEV